MNELVDAIKAQTDALAEQTKIMGHLVEAICALVDTYEPDNEDTEQATEQAQYLLDGTRIS